MDALACLKLEHRNVLTLRCLDGLPYAQIAAILGGSDLRARLLFLRGKQSLRHQLRHRGFDKGDLLPALATFSTLSTFRTKTACAVPRVSAGSACVTPGIMAIGLIASRLGLLAASVLIAVGLTVGRIQRDPGPGVSTEQAAQPGSMIPFDMMDPGHSMPSGFVRIEKPNGSQWLACDNSNPDRPPLAVQLRKLDMKQLWGHFALILPSDHALEMQFSAAFLDGPGPEFLIAGRPAGLEPQVHVTDGAGQTYSLKPSICRTLATPEKETVFAFDLSGLQLPFQPKGVQVLGCSSKTSRHGAYELVCVHARTGRNARWAKHSR